MILGGLYSVFNGLELLEGSIAQVIEDLDVLIICWQKVSNKGEISEELPQYLNRFVHNPKVKLIEYATDIKLSTKDNELAKHNLMLSEAKKSGCTHFFISACDHYYIKEQIRYAKKLILERGYDATATALYTYYKYPYYRLDPPEAYYMPFICRLYLDTQFRKGQYFCYVDPAVKAFPYSRPYLFSADEVVLYHFSMIRVDIRNKFRNAAASVNWTRETVDRFIKEYENARPGDSISYFKGRKIVVRYAPFFL